MEEIKVGEYIRTPYNTIEKVVEIEKQECRAFTTVTTDTSCYQLEWLEAWETKHSPNIIDLIEEGDYVNGELVTSIIDLFDKNEYIKGKKLITQYRTAQYSGLDNRYYIYEQDIKSIVTKEQFEQMKYIVGDESNE